MAICSNCKSEGLRTRTIWAEDGSKREECPQCAPESFGKVTSPSDKKIWMGYEAHPNEYEKKYDKDGLIYERKPEYRAEQEAKIIQQTEEEQERQRLAEEHKRKTRRTQEMDAVEMAMATRKAEEIAHWIMQSGGSVN